MSPIFRPKARGRSYRVLSQVFQPDELALVDTRPACAWHQKSGCGMLEDRESFDHVTGLEQLHVVDGRLLPGSVAVHVAVAFPRFGRRRRAAVGIAGEL